MEYLNFATKVLDSNDWLNLAYVDFRKAFDKVNHDALLVKLEMYGIDGVLLQWFRDYLENRRQSVSVNVQFSNWYHVSSGVPVLGPLLYLVFINDIDEHVSGAIYKFADDQRLARRINRRNADWCFDAMQTDLDGLSAYCSDWLLEINDKKSHIMHCGYENPRALYSLLNNTRGSW